MELNKKSTICDIIVNYMENKKDAVATLKEMYKVVNEKWKELKKETRIPTEETIRASIYKSPKKYNFERIGKGLYLLKGEKTSSLLIHGDSRKLEEIGDEVIDCIITDHPWKDSKAHKSGNQKGFAEYETFEYTQEDFNTKARVLKKGSFLVEFLPVESATNWQYLSKIKEMAKNAGLQYYCQTIWRKAPEGEINTGRTTKGVEQLIIFSKGKPRRLSPKGKPYMTKNMLSYEINIPANKGKNKVHQAEKNIELYEYLIENLTEEFEICLDQFGGSCNLLKASINKNRWGIVYEKAKEFVVNAYNRFKMLNIFTPEENIKEKTETLKKVEVTVDEPVNKGEVFQMKNLSKETTDFQLKHLNNCIKYKKNLFTQENLSLMEIINKSDDIYVYAIKIDEIFNMVNKEGYKNYRLNLFDIQLNDLAILNPIYKKINSIYKEFNADTRSFYKNVKYELEMFSEYAVTQKRKNSYDEIMKKDVLNDYLNFLKSKNLNYKRSFKILSQYVK